MALNNLGTHYSQVGRGADIDDVWEDGLRSLANPSDKTFLLVRRAKDRPPGDQAAVKDLLTAQSIVPKGEAGLIADLHAVGRAQRTHDPGGFDRAWQRLSGSEPPSWLTVPEAQIELVWQWFGAGSHETGRKFLADHADELLVKPTDPALDEIALRLHDPSAIQLFRDLLERARRVGIDEAYRPLLAMELLSMWMAAEPALKRSMMMERRDELLGIDVADALRRLREDASEDPTLAAHDALLALARSGREDFGFEAMTEPERAPGLLSDLARVGDVATLDALATLARFVKSTDAVHASAWFYKAIALVLKNDPDEALDAGAEARRIDPQQVATWLGLLVELATHHPGLVLLSKALLAPPPQELVDT